MKLNKSPNMNRGSAFLSLIFLAFFLIILMRFLYIMITGNIHGVNLVEKRDMIITDRETLEGKRGQILTREGEKIAADSQIYTIAAILKKTKNNQKNYVKDVSLTSENLSKVLNVDPNEIEKLLTNNENDTIQVELGKIGRNITFTQMEEISDMKLPGIIFMPDIKRTYPLGDFASHIVGITDYEGKGISGIEKEFHKEMQGTDGYIKEKVDEEGFKLPTEDIVSKPPSNGNNIHTTLDMNIQSILEDSMNHVIEEYDPEKIMGVVMDPKTGEILALSNRPSIYPNEENEVNYINYGISYPFEPGSTMKIFTLAAAINEGEYNGDALYKSGSYQVLTDTIHDHKRDGWGTITFNEGVQKSSNVAFAILAEKRLGFDRFYNYLHKFGFDKTTEIDVAGEKKGTILYNYPIEKVTTAFGQGSTTTPIQLVTAATAIANKGKMMKPYVVKKITNDKGEVIKSKKPSVIGKPVTAETAKKTRELLSSVVNDGTGTKFQLKDFQVAGKTGTAQIPDGKGSYQSGRNNYIFSFLGMAPAKDPRLIVYVAVEKPNLRANQVGADPVSEIFNTVMNYGLNKLNVTVESNNTKDKDTQEFTITLKSYNNKSLENTVNDLGNVGLEPVILGKEGKVVETSPTQGTELIKGSKVMVKTSAQSIMPDIKGWSLSDVMKLGKLTGLEVEHQGEGFVSQQSIVPGEAINGQTLTIKLSKSD